MKNLKNLLAVVLLCAMALTSFQVEAKGGLMAQCDNERIQNLLQRAGFSLEPPVTKSQMLKAISKDKKSEGNFINAVFPRAIGKCVVEKMPLDEFKALV